MKRFLFAGFELFFASFSLLVLVRQNVVCQESQPKKIRPVLEGPYGNYLKECKANYVEVSKDRKRFLECQKKLFLALVPRLETPEGVPELDVPSLNPYRTKDYNLGDGGMFKGSWYDSETYGATRLFTEENISLTWNETDKTMLASLKGDRLETRGKYSFYINLVGLLRPDSADPSAGTHGGGSSTVFLKNGVYSVKFYMRERKNGALALEKAEGKLLSLQEVEGTFQGSSPNDPIANMLKRVVNELKADTILQVVNDVLPPFNRYLAQMAGNIVHKGWRALEKL